MLTSKTLPKTYKVAGKRYEFSEEDKRQILEDGGFVEAACVEVAIRLGGSYAELRRSSIAHGG